MPEQESILHTLQAVLDELILELEQSLTFAREYHKDYFFIYYLQDAYGLANDLAHDFPHNFVPDLYFDLERTLARAKALANECNITHYDVLPTLLRFFDLDNKYFMGKYHGGTGGRGTPVIPVVPAHVRLDAAAPEQVYLERVFDVAAAIRLPTSPLFKEEDLTYVKSGDAHLFWPDSDKAVRLRLQVKAPECQIIGSDHYTFFFSKNEDSPVFYFSLIPQQIGDITIIVTLYQEDDTLGNTRIRTTAITQIVGGVHFAVTSRFFPVDFSDQAMVTARIPLGLAPDLSARLRSIFTNSIHFASSATLQALFVDTRLSPWHDLIPDNTRNRATRVNGLIHTLYDKTNTAGENALVLFLYVLADHTDPSDAQHDTLTALATDLERAIAESPTD